MIRVTKMDGKKFTLNADWIQSVESTPDTVVTLTTGEKLLVAESEDQVVEAFLHYKQTCFHEPEVRKTRVRKLEVKR